MASADATPMAKIKDLTREQLEAQLQAMGASETKTDVLPTLDGSNSSDETLLSQQSGTKRKLAETDKPLSVPAQTKKVNQINDKIAQLNSDLKLIKKQIERDGETAPHTKRKKELVRKIGLKEAELKTETDNLKVSEEAAKQKQADANERRLERAEARRQKLKNDRLAKKKTGDAKQGDPEKALEKAFADGVAQQVLSDILAGAAADNFDSPSEDEEDEALPVKYEFTTHPETGVLTFTTSVHGVQQIIGNMEDADEPIIEAWKQEQKFQQGYLHALSTDEADWSVDKRITVDELTTKSAGLFREMQLIKKLRKAMPHCTVTFTGEEARLMQIAHGVAILGTPASTNAKEIADAPGNDVVYLCKPEGAVSEHNAETATAGPPKLPKLSSNDEGGR